LRTASVQTVRLGIDAIHDEVVALRDGEYRAVLEVSGTVSPFEDDVQQESLLASFAAFLNALGYPIQVLVRATPVDLSRYVSGIEDRAGRESHVQLVALAHDHAAFVQSLARQRTLLERRFYVVVPAEARPAVRWWQALPGRRHQRSHDDEPRREAAARQLMFRCDEVMRQLGRCGLTSRRLGDLDLAHLYLACWSPERARAQRFRQQLDDYTTLAVRAARSSAEVEAARAAV
jgi:hypothetical protein